MSRMAARDFPTELIEPLERWVNELAKPLLPPRIVVEGDVARLRFREHIPHAVMIGKLIRAVSGFRPALVLAELGYIAECAALLRMVSDFCSEIAAVGEALDAGGELAPAVRAFVEQYFAPKARTPEEFARQERTRYTSREDLLKMQVPSAQRAGIDQDEFRKLRRFLNMTYDAYLHGAYETAMELYNPGTGDFAMHGNVDPAQREEFIEAALLKVHEVVVAIEITAAVTSQPAVFTEARAARRTMDASAPWNRDSIMDRG
jgi:hypothetical protein